MKKENEAAKKENVQQTVSRKPLATGFPNTASGALPRKGLSAKGKLNLQQLIQTLPQDRAWDFGTAIDNGDCFYDAIAQSLHARASNSTHTIKSLREICSKYIYQLNEQSPQANWVKEAIEKDKGIDDYQTHLTSVQFTQGEMARLKQENNVLTGYAIWGKSHIEGKILAQQLNISLHIIEFHEAGSGMEGAEPTHILVTKDKVTQVEKECIRYQDEQLIHLAVYRIHFVPILPSHYLKQQQSNPEDSSQEMTQFNKHSPKKVKEENENKRLNISNAADSEEKQVGSSKLTPNQERFYLIFRSELLTIFNSCQDTIKNPTKVKGADLDSLINNLANLTEGITGTAAQNEAAGKAGSEATHVVGDLIKIGKSYSDGKAMQKATHFIKNIKVASEKELQELADTVAVKLYCRFKDGIERLANTEGGVNRLAQFFTFAIIIHLIEEELLLRPTSDSLVEMLIMNAIPNEDSSSYKKFKLKNKKLETKEDKDWTIVGLLCHSPGVTGDGTQLKLENTRSDSKYPLQQFATVEEAQTYGFVPALIDGKCANLAKQIQRLKAKRDLTIGAKKVEIEKVIKSIQARIHWLEHKQKRIEAKMKDSENLAAQKSKQLEQEYGELLKIKELAEKNIALSYSKIEEYNDFIEEFNEQIALLDMNKEDVPEEEIQKIEEDIQKIEFEKDAIISCKKFNIIINAFEKKNIAVVNKKKAELEETKKSLLKQTWEKAAKLKEKLPIISKKKSAEEIELQNLQKKLDEEERQNSSETKTLDEEIARLDSMLREIARTVPNEVPARNEISSLADKKIFAQIVEGNVNEVTISSENSNIDLILAGMLPYAEQVEIFSMDGVTLTAKLPLLLAFLSTKNIALETLVLRNTQLQDEDICMIAKTIMENKDLQLRELNLEENHIGSEGAKTLGKMLIDNPTLEILNISRTHLGGDGLMAIAEGLQYNTNTYLKQLLLNYNEIDGKDAKDALEKFAVAIKQNPESKLTSLDFKGNPLGFMGIKMLIKALRENSLLRGFYFRETALNDAAAMLLCNAIETRCAEIKILDLSDNDITSKFAPHLNELITNNQIRSLLLEFCKFGDEGARGIIPGLNSNNSLEWFNLTANGITNVPLEEFFPALVNGKELTGIALSNNPIGSQGLQLLCKAIAGSKTAATLNQLFLDNIFQGQEPVDISPLLNLLKENKLINLKGLALGGNNLQDKDAFALAEALKIMNASFEWLWLQNNCITLEGIVAILKSLVHHNSIEKICIHGNSLSPEDIEQFQVDPSCRVLLPKLIQWVPNDFAISRSNTERISYDKFELSLQDQLKGIIDINNSVLSCARCGDARAQDIAQVIQAYIQTGKFLIGLDLCCNQFTKDGIEIIFQSILTNEKQRKALESLDIKDNPSLGDEVAIVLANFIANTELRKLTYDNINITDEGNNIILEVAGKSKTLQSLNVHNSPITLKGTPTSSRSSSIGSIGENPSGLFNKTSKRLFSFQKEGDLALRLAKWLSLIEFTNDTSRELFGLESYAVHYVSGNCLFEAVAAFVNGKSGQVIREACVKHLQVDEQLKDRIKALTEGRDNPLKTKEGEKYFRSFDEYINLMSQDQTWGTEIELVALARELQRPITILTPKNTYDQVIEEEDYAENEPIFLNYVNQNHYEPLSVPNDQDSRSILEQIRESIAEKHDSHILKP